MESNPPETNIREAPIESLQEQVATDRNDDLVGVTTDNVGVGKDPVPQPKRTLLKLQDNDGPVPRRSGWIRKKAGRVRRLRMLINVCYIFVVFCLRIKPT